MKRGRKWMAEEIYYISIKPIRIENSRTVAAAQTHPLIDID